MPASSVHPPDMEATHEGMNGNYETVNLIQRTNTNDAIEQSPLFANGSTNNERLKHARRLLYVSHLFSQFSEVSWQFCLILFLAAFTNYSSLILVSTYGLTCGIAVCLTGSKAGRFIDGTNRLFVARTFIWTENVSVLIATLFCYTLLLSRADKDPETFHAKLNGPAWSYWFRSRMNGVPLDALSVVMLIGIHILGSIAQILDRGFLVAMERDWIVVMSRVASPSYDNVQSNTTEHIPDATERAWLSTTNVTMKQIDLSCKVAAPAVAGFIVGAFNNGTGDSHPHGGDLSSAALLVGLVNFAALVVEYVCTARIYALIPDLAIKKSRPSRESSLLQHDNDDTTSTVSTPEQDVDEPECTPTSSCGICKLPDGLQTYLDQPMSLGGIGFALLYLNVLTFGAIMTAYLVWRGMRLETVGLWRGVSSAIGLMGTFVYSYSMKFFTVETTGMWSIVFQFVCLSLSYVSLFVGDYNTSLCMLIAGVCASRVGLWVFDISVTQLFQEHVASDVRGIVGGVQESLNAFFGLFAFVLGIFIPDPRQFHLYVAVGYGSVGVAMILYTFGVYTRRDSLTPRHVALLP